MAKNVQHINDMRFPIDGTNRLRDILLHGVGVQRVG